MHRRAIGGSLLVVGCALLAACGGVAPTPTTAPVARDPRPDQSAPALDPTAGLGNTGSTTIPVEPAATPIPSDAPFRRRDAPPNGVPDQIAFGFGNTEGCFKSYYDRHPELGLDPFADPVNIKSSWVFEVARQSILGNDGVCFAWVQPNRHVEITITDPEGSVEQKRIRADADGFAFLPWLSLPGDPFGTYRFVAVQGELRLEGSWTLAPATEPRLAVAPMSGPPGTIFTLAAAGFPAGQRVPVRIYSFDDYVTTVEIVIGPDGDGLAQLVSAAGDPPGVYIPLVLKTNLLAAVAGDTIDSQWLTLTAITLTALPPNLPLEIADLQPGAPAAATSTSPFQRQEPAPAGVTGQLPLDPGAGPTCEQAIDPSQPSTITLSATGIELGQTTLACLQGFFSFQPVQYALLLPGGGILQGEADPQTGIPWIALPDDPPGLYQLTVTQGERMAMTTFTVGAPTQRNTVVFPGDGPPGTRRFVALAGFEQGSTVQLRLYYDCELQSLCYGSALGTVEIDSQGGAIVGIPTTLNDPAGVYAIETTPASYRSNPGSQAVFALTER